MFLHSSFCHLKQGMGMRHHNTWRTSQRHIRRRVFHTGLMAWTLFWFMIMHTGCFERRIGDSCEYTGGHENTNCDEGICVADICREPAHQGDECLTHAHCTDPGTHCYRVSEAEPTGICASYLEAGETCLWGYSICDPEQRLFCYQNTCIPPQPEGAGCRMAWSSCQEGLYCVPADGLPFKDLPTLDRESGLCKPGQGQDGLCNIQMKVGCATGYICSIEQLNTCQPEGTIQ